MEACAKCTQNCLLIHRENVGQVSKVSSFFKVMSGKHFSEVLFLPPKFTKTLRLRARKEMYLTDSSRKKWRVVLSNENGSLALKNGWYEFSEDHDIEVGDVVIFHYIMGSSHFAVQIFGRSGCEKLAFSTEKIYQNKRMKTTSDPVNLQCPYSAFYPNPPAKKNPSSCGISQPNDNVIQRQDEGENSFEKSSSRAENVPSHEKIVQGQKREPARDFLEDLSFMLDRDMSFAKGDKEDLLDLSIFEMSEKKEVAKKVENQAASVDAKKFHFDEGNTFSKNEESILLKKESSSLPSGCPSTDLPSCSSMTKKPDDMLHKSEFLAPSVSPGSWDWNAMPSIANHGGVAYGLEDPGAWIEGWWRDLGNLGPTLTPTPTSSGPMPNTQSSEMAGVTRIVKQEPREFIGDSSTDEVADTSMDIPCHNANLSISNDELGVIVKCEPIDLFDSFPEPVLGVGKR